MAHEGRGSKPVQIHPQGRWDARLPELRQLSGGGDVLCDIHEFAVELHRGALQEGNRLVRIKVHAFHQDALRLPDRRAVHQGTLELRMCSSASSNFIRSVAISSGIIAGADDGASDETDVRALPRPLSRMLTARLLPKGPRNCATSGSWQLVGRAARPSALQRAKRTARAKVPGLPAGFCIQDLRPYFASMLIASGADVKVVQARMRHASAKTTVDTCSHLWPDSTRAAIEAAMTAR